MASVFATFGLISKLEEQADELADEKEELATRVVAMANQIGAVRTSLQQTIAEKEQTISQQEQTIQDQQFLIEQLWRDLAEQKTKYEKMLNEATHHDDELAFENMKLRAELRVSKNVGSYDVTWPNYPPLSRTMYNATLSMEDWSKQFSK